MSIWLAVPSPSPTGRPAGVEAVESPGFWIAVMLVVAFFLLVRAVNRWLGWGSRGDE